MRKVMAAALMISASAIAVLGQKPLSDWNTGELKLLTYRYSIPSQMEYLANTGATLCSLLGLARLPTPSGCDQLPCIF